MHVKGTLFVNHKFSKISLGVYKATTNLLSYGDVGSHHLSIKGSFVFVGTGEKCIYSCKVP